MLYRRRGVDLPNPQLNFGETMKSKNVNKMFQYKYCWYMLTAVAGGALLFLIPAFYFLMQNYELFKTLAFDTQPHLIEHLEREVTWLKVFFSISFIFIACITLILSASMTKNLLAPLAKIEKHMRQLMLGKWNISDYQLTDDEDFRELGMTYDYFYRSLKANTSVELTLLSKLSIDPQNREAYAAWKQLISTKRSRLGIKDEIISIENVASLHAIDPKHRAS
jgi:hypothetical protein